MRPSITHIKISSKEILNVTQLVQLILTFEGKKVNIKNIDWKDKVAILEK